MSRYLNSLAPQIGFCLTLVTIGFMLEISTSLQCEDINFAPRRIPQNSPSQLTGRRSLALCTPTKVAVSERIDARVGSRECGTQPGHVFCSYPFVMRYIAIENEHVHLIFPSIKLWIFPVRYINVDLDGIPFRQSIYWVGLPLAALFCGQIHHLGTGFQLNTNLCRISHPSTAG